TLKNAWTTSRQVNFFWVANFNLKFGNDYHKINTGNQSNFYENVKDNEIKDFLTKVSNLFFKKFLMKQSKTINLKLAH
ncbi:hypothetical protein RKU08_00825, partial [Streptococcus pneumoniae]|nr:hypothetical protein [Streptococcus pneumoniae]MDT5902350.1 hypothetical protein [Streptococcus pneumoniae]